MANGLNHRKSWHYDTDTDGDVDASDKTYRFAFDTRWRMVATFRDADSNPKERFVWQNAGLNGRGGSSYIDSAVLRDRDMTSGWTGSADGTLEERHYYCQNWRADVSVVLKYEDSVWRVAEWIKYSAYGVPFSITPADFDNSGFVDIDDDTAFDAAYNGGAGSWSARVDLDLDGSLTSADEDIFDAEFIGGENGGRHVLSRESVANRLGYAGYQYDPTFVGAERSLFHVRHRVYDSGSGRWTRRDPMGMRFGLDLYSYGLFPLITHDPLGLFPALCGGGQCDNQPIDPPIIDLPEIPIITPWRPGKDSETQCSEDVNWCMNNDPVIAEQLSDLNNCNNDFPSTLKVTCGGGGGAGGYSCELGRIRITPGQSRPAVCETLRHELQHALDDCHSAFKCGGDKDDGGNFSCAALACSEVRAYVASGKCCKESRDRRGDKRTYCQCIIEEVGKSLILYRDNDGSHPCSDTNDAAQNAINAAAECYNRVMSPCQSESPEACVYDR